MHTQLSTVYTRVHLALQQHTHIHACADEHRSKITRAGSDFK